MSSGSARARFLSRGALAREEETLNVQRSTFNVQVGGDETARIRIEMLDVERWTFFWFRFKNS